MLEPKAKHNSPAAAIVAFHRSGKATTVIAIEPPAASGHISQESKQSKE
jgi:hypothetical protein